MAQNVYDDSEDHFAQMNSVEDEAAKTVFLEAVNKFDAIDINNDIAIRQMIEGLHQKIINTNSPYIRSLNH